MLKINVYSYIPFGTTPSPSEWMTSAICILLTIDDRMVHRFSAACTAGRICTIVVVWWINTIENEQVAFQSRATFMWRISHVIKVHLFSVYQQVLENNPVWNAPRPLPFRHDIPCYCVVWVTVYVLSPHNFYDLFEIYCQLPPPQWHFQKYISFYTQL